MGLTKILIIIVGIIVALAYFAPDTYEAGKDWVLDFLKEKAPDSQSIYDAAEETYSRTREALENETETETEEVEGTDDGDVNACGFNHYAFPDYTGTPKEGDTCADVMEAEADFECLANPPDGYDGYINVITKYSYPTLTCCYADGTCQWELTE